MQVVSSGTSCRMNEAFYKGFTGLPQDTCPCQQKLLSGRVSSAQLSSAPSSPRLQSNPYEPDSEMKLRSLRYHTPRVSHRGPFSTNHRSLIRTRVSVRHCAATCCKTRVRVSKSNPSGLDTDTRAWPDRRLVTMALMMLRLAGMHSIRTYACPAPAHHTAVPL